MKYIKRLNWSGAGLIFCFCMLAALMRKQDDNIQTSLIFGLVIGIPISILFLFGGIKDKE